MRLLALSGQRSAALAQHESCCRILAEELGVEPDTQTTMLHERIRDRTEILFHAPAPPNNLPAPLTPFVGREEELTQIEERLQDPSCRLLTLTGPGGIGKTRLALEAAAAQMIQFTHGVFLVSLAPLASADALVPAVAEALGFSFHEEGEPEQQLRDYLRQRTLLLVMDNFEHLPDGADWVVNILRTAPGLTILATSRTRLNVQGEHLFPVCGMDLPEQEDSDDVTQYGAVKLFLQTARRVQPGFALADGELSDVTETCRLVQGMPLGILLAAPWVEKFTPAEIVARISGQIGQNLDLLATDLRGVPERQRSIRAVFDHSWNLLTQREQATLQQLSVFRGGFTQRAAQEVAVAPPEELTTLVNKSLLQRAPEGRYEMHEFVRQCAAEKLERLPAAGEAARDRHSAYYAALLQQREADLRGSRQQIALAEIKADIENARVAWDWATSRGQVRRLEQALEPLCLFYEWRVRYREGEAVCRSVAEKLTAAKSGDELRVQARILTWQSLFSRHRGHIESANQLMRQSLALLERPEMADQDTRPEKATILLQMGRMAVLSDREKARRMYEQSLALYRALGDRWEMANALSGLAGVAWNLGDYDEAKELYEETLAIRRALGDPKGTANSLSSLGFTVLYQGQLEEAERLIQESIAIRQEIGDRFGLANGLRNLGMTSLSLGRFARACSLLEESLAIFTDLGFRYSLEVAMVGVAEVHLGRYDRARALAQRGLDISRETDFRRGRGFSLIVLGELALAKEAYPEAHELLQESVAVYREINQREKLSWALADLGRSALGLGDTHRAQRHLYQALQTATQIRAFVPTVLALSAIALFLTEQGQKERAVELYALISRYPLVANSRWFEDTVGQQIEAVVASLPADTVAAIRDRGEDRDLDVTVDELLAELN